MWFKNLYIVQLADPFTISSEELHEKLLAQLAKPCGTLQPSSYGWTSPLGHEGQLLVHTIGPYMMLAARKETKLLPNSIIREALTNKIIELEQTQNRKISKKEKASLKEEIYVQMMARAFHKAQTTYGYIDIKNNWVIIDTANAKKADEFLELLRKSVGKLDVATLQTNKTPRVVMTNWLTTKHTPADFTIETQCQMFDPQDIKTIIKCVNHDLMADEIIQHLRAHKQITELALTWKNQISFTLCDNLILKRFQFLDMIKAEIQDTQAESPAERFDADFAIMTAAISELLPNIFELFEGLSKIQQAEPAEFLHA